MGMSSIAYPLRGSITALQLVPAALRQRLVFALVAQHAARALASCATDLNFLVSRKQVGWHRLRKNIMVSRRRSSARTAAKKTVYADERYARHERTCIKGIEQQSRTRSSLSCHIYQTKYLSTDWDGAPFYTKQEPPDCYALKTLVFLCSDVEDHDKDNKNHSLSDNDENKAAKKRQKVELYE